MYNIQFKDVRSQAKESRIIEESTGLHGHCKFVNLPPPSRLSHAVYQESSRMGKLKRNMSKQGRNQDFGLGAGGGTMAKIWRKISFERGIIKK